MSELAKPKNPHHKCIELIASLEAERDRFIQEKMNLDKEWATESTKQNVEIDRLKAELESVLADQQGIIRRDKEVLSIVCKDRDLWKSKWESEHRIADTNYERRKVAESKAAVLTAEVLGLRGGVEHFKQKAEKLAVELEGLKKCKDSGKK